MNEHVQNGGYPWAYQTRLLTEADIDPAMVDWEVVGDGDPQALPGVRSVEQPLDLLAGPSGRGRGSLGRRELDQVHVLGFDQDLSRLRDDELEEVAGKIADISEFNPMIDPALYGDLRGEAEGRHHP